MRPARKEVGRLRRLALAAVLVVGCGGASSSNQPSVTGHWLEQITAVNQGRAEMTLSQSGASITGSGVQHREAGTDVAFTVSATSSPVPGPGFTITYADGTSQGFVFGLADANHFTLQTSGANGITRTFARQ